MYLCLCQGKYTWFWLGALMFYLLECADALWYFPFEPNQILSVNIGFQYVNEFKNQILVHIIPIQYVQYIKTFFP